MFELIYKKVTSLMQSLFYRLKERQAYSYYMNEVIVSLLASRELHLSAPFVDFVSNSVLSFKDKPKEKVLISLLDQYSLKTDISLADIIDISNPTYTQNKALIIKKDEAYREQLYRCLVLHLYWGCYKNKQTGIKPWVSNHLRHKIECVIKSKKAQDRSNDLIALIYIGFLTRQYWIRNAGSVTPLNIPLSALLK